MKALVLCSHWDANRNVLWSSYVEEVFPTSHCSLADYAGITVLDRHHIIPSKCQGTMLAGIAVAHQSLLRPNTVCTSNLPFSCRAADDWSKMVARLTNWAFLKMELA